jgi:hypothetical protein
MLLLWLILACVAAAAHAEQLTLNRVHSVLRSCLHDEVSAYNDTLLVLKCLAVSSECDCLPSAAYISKSRCLATVPDSCLLATGPSTMQI